MGLSLYPEANVKLRRPRLPRVIEQQREAGLTEAHDGNHRNGQGQVQFCSRTARLLPDDANRDRDAVAGNKRSRQTWGMYGSSVTAETSTIVATRRIDTLDIAT